MSIMEYLNKKPATNNRAEPRQPVMAIRDAAMQAYMNPWTAPTIGVAVRSFTDEVNRPDATNNLYNHSADYELWHIADWLPTTGAFAQIEDGPRCVARAVEVSTKKPE